MALREGEDHRGVEQAWLHVHHCGVRILMPGGSRRAREERALDALLVSILRRVDKDDDIVEPEKLPQLTEEEKAAMNALGPNFIDRILAGERPVPPKPKPDRPNESEGIALAGCGADTS